MQRKTFHLVAVALLALGAVDNLGKGAAGQAMQNANLLTGEPETAGLTGMPLPA